MIVIGLAVLAFIVVCLLALKFRTFGRSDSILPAAEIRQLDQWWEETHSNLALIRKLQAENAELREMLEYRRTNVEVASAHWWRQQEEPFFSIRETVRR